MLIHIPSILILDIIQ